MSLFESWNANKTRQDAVKCALAPGSRVLDVSSMSLLPPRQSSQSSLTFRLRLPNRLRSSNLPRITCCREPQSVHGCSAFYPCITHMRTTCRSTPKGLTARFFSTMLLEGCWEASASRDSRRSVKSCLVELRSHAIWDHSRLVGLGCRI